MVEVLTTDVLVTAGHADDLEAAVGPLQESGVEGAAAEVVDAHARAEIDVLGCVVDGCGDGLLHELHVLQTRARGGLGECCAPYTGPPHRVSDDAPRRVAARPQPAFGDDHSNHCRGRVARVDRFTTEQERGGGTERTLRGSLESIRVYPGKVVSCGADDQFARGRAQDHRWDPPVAFDLQRRHGRGRNRRDAPPGGGIGGEAPGVEFADRSCRARCAEVDPDGPAHPSSSTPPVCRDRVA